MGSALEWLCIDVDEPFWVDVYFAWFVFVVDSLKYIILRLKDVTFSQKTILERLLPVMEQPKAQLLMVSARPRGATGKYMQLSPLPFISLYQKKDRTV